MAAGGRPPKAPEQDSNYPQKQADFDGLENRTPQYTPQQLLDVLKQHLDPPKLAELAALLQQHQDQLQLPVPAVSTSARQRRLPRGTKRTP
jgi:hypothetical protein